MVAHCCSRGPKKLYGTSPNVTTAKYDSTTGLRVWDADLGQDSTGCVFGDGYYECPAVLSGLGTPTLPIRRLSLEDGIEDFRSLYLPGHGYSECQLSVTTTGLLLWGYASGNHYFTLFDSSLNVLWDFDTPITTTAGVGTLQIADDYVTLHRSKVASGTNDTYETEVWGAGSLACTITVTEDNTVGLTRPSQGCVAGSTVILSTHDSAATSKSAVRTYDLSGGQLSDVDVPAGNAFPAKISGDRSGLFAPRYFFPSGTSAGTITASDATIDFGLSYDATYVLARSTGVRRWESGGSANVPVSSYTPIHRIAIFDDADLFVLGRGDNRSLAKFDVTASSGSAVWEIDTLEAFTFTAANVVKNAFDACMPGLSVDSVGDVYVSGIRRGLSTIH